MNLTAAFQLLFGIYCTLLGFGILAPGKNSEHNERWMKKFGTFMKIGGPFMILSGLLQFLFGLLR
ncbi:MAG: hypothetical protein NTZ46_02140 [Verrucomicrobia bacterium]|nr:hypothetical protein [Verrucomicrobiota bacterium]